MPWWHAGEPLPPSRLAAVTSAWLLLSWACRSYKDGSKVTYLQLAHNEWHPETGSPVAKVIHDEPGRFLDFELPAPTA